MPNKRHAVNVTREAFNYLNIISLPLPCYISKSTTHVEIFSSSVGYVDTSRSTPQSKRIRHNKETKSPDKET
jgi:hypothetical protein